MDCSNGGVCLGEFGGGTSATVEEDESESVPQAPDIHLVSFGDVLASRVNVKRGMKGGYRPCDAETEQQPSEAVPCELGAIASVGGTEEDLTDEVVVCPPDNCIPPKV